MGNTSVRFISLKGNRIKVDGGTMFGTAKKSQWEKWVGADEQNLITLGSRVLLVRTKNFNILFDPGPGIYSPPGREKEFENLDKDHLLLESLEEQGLDQEDITHIIFSHLHFNHAGAILGTQGLDAGKLLFPNAVIITGKTNFQRSCSPHVRDASLFIPKLAFMLEKTKRLVLISENKPLKLDDLDLSFIESQGHTPGMLLPYIQTQRCKLLLAGDMIPGQAWVDLEITTGYDRFPELLMDEKKEILEKVFHDGAWVFYMHDETHCASKLFFDDQKGKYLPIDPVNDLSLVLNP